MSDRDDCYPPRAHLVARFSFWGSIPESSVLSARLTAGTDAEDPKSMHRIAVEETVAIPESHDQKTGTFSSIMIQTSRSTLSRDRLAAAGFYG